MNMLHFVQIVLLWTVFTCSATASTFEVIQESSNGELTFLEIPLNTATPKQMASALAKSGVTFSDHLNGNVNKYIYEANKLSDWPAKVELLISYMPNNIGVKTIQYFIHPYGNSENEIIKQKGLLADSLYTQFTDEDQKNVRLRNYHDDSSNAVRKYAWRKDGYVVALTYKIPTRPDILSFFPASDVFGSVKSGGNVRKTAYK